MAREIARLVTQAMPQQPQIVQGASGKVYQQVSAEAMLRTVKAR